MSTTYIALLRGVNVGGKNKVPMVNLKCQLEELGFDSVITYLQSGNVIFRSDQSAESVKNAIQEMLPRQFTVDSKDIKVLILKYHELKAVIEHRPSRFGDQPANYHCDVIFLIGIKVEDTAAIFKPRDGVDQVWPGVKLFYFQRLSSLRTKSRLSAAMSSELYKSMTIRSWGTTTKLLQLAHQIEETKESNK